jgi:two-component system sensor histidine kinase MtrB
VSSSRWLRVGVRRRVQLSFAVGGLALSVFLGSVTWAVTTRYLYEQRAESTIRQTAASLQQVEQGLRALPRRPAEVLDRSRSPSSDALLFLDGSWFSSELGLAADDLPDALLIEVAAGTPVQQRVRIEGRPKMVVALPLAGSPGDAYFEVFPMSGLDLALRTLSLVLVAVGLVSTLLAAAIGRWAAERTLRPLRVVSAGAARVAEGELDARLDGRGDPDLAPLADAFNATTSRLQERVERDARFASDISHELRSPVTTLVNAVQLLANRSPELTAEGREALALLHRETARFAALVEDLLVVSRDAQAADLDCVEVRIADVVRRTADAAAGRPVTSVAQDAQDVLVAADLRRLRRVITNLVRNAEVHGGGVREACVHAVPGGIQLSVLDCGAGVPPELRERVFDRFFRAPASRAATQGSGLGLAIVAQDVHVHGGRVWVEDGVPDGARFVVELPVAPERT